MTPNINALLDLYYETRTGESWKMGHAVYSSIAMMRWPSGEPAVWLTSPSDSKLLGMKVIIDPSISPDTIELRDKDDQVVGKIVNIS